MADKTALPHRPLLPRIVTALLFIFVPAVFALSSERAFVYFDFIILFIVFGLIDFRRWFVIKSQRVDIVDIAFLLLFLYEIINYWLSQYPPNSFSYLEKVTAYVLFYFFLRMYIGEGKVLSRLLFLMVVIAFVLAVGNLLYFIPYYTGKKELAELSDYKALYQPLGINSNELASLFLCLLPFPAWFVLKSRSIFSKLFCLLTLVLCVFGVLVTFSRGAYIALGIWIILVPAMLYIFKIFTTRQTITCLLALILITVVAAVPVYRSVGTTLAFGKTTSQQLSAEGRKELFKTGFEIAKKHALYGAGSNNFPLEYAINKKQTEAVKFNGNVTNSWLQLLIEKGIPGLVLYAALFLIVFINSYRKLRTAEDNDSRLMLVVFLSSLLALLVRELFYAAVLINDPLLLLVFIICFVCIRCADKSTLFLSVNNGQKKIYWPVFIIAALMTLPFCKKIMAEFSYTAALNAYDQGQYEKAHQLFAKCIANDGGNATYLAYAGLTIANNPVVSVANVLDSSYTFNTAYSNKIDSAIHYYEKAIRLHEDDLFVHNTGWLYFIKGQQGLAQTCFKRAVALDPNVALYHISLGMSYEKAGLPDNASNEYALAIRLSPDVLDAAFFKALTARSPQIAAGAINQARQGLETTLQNSHDVKLSAKLAKIYLNNNSIDKARDLFLKITVELPNLNRPWLYLGDIYRQTGDTTKMMSYYQRGATTDPNDYLADLKLGDYYKAGNDTAKANRYYKAGYQKWSTIFPEYSTKTSIVYRLKRSIHNNVLPTDMLQYIRTFPKQ